MNTPLALIAELTHRCPLRCAYCSNPLELEKKEHELPTDVWISVFKQACELGVLQLHLTGGEPLARIDIVQLVRAASGTGLYTNLITSGIGLNTLRLDELIEAGLDHLQLSIQGSSASVADSIAGVKAHERKIAIAKEIRKRNIAFTVNAVVHRTNVHELPEIIALAEEIGAHKLEIAHVQYYGWAFTNRDLLLPTHEQLEESIEIVKTATERLAGKMRIDFVYPDYYAKYPKACMGGWGMGAMLITPSGEVWPCHAAGILPGLTFENVKDQALSWIWHESQAFNRYRGTDWMQEPCQSCDRREKDFGGCRCQALMLAQDATQTDPVCSLSPQHSLVQALTDKNSTSIYQINLISTSEWLYRL